MKLLLTAGYDNSLPALLTAERLCCDGHSVSAVIVVSPYSIKRLRELLRSRGANGFKKALEKIFHGAVSTGQSGLNPLRLLKTRHQLETNSLKVWSQKNNIPCVVVKSINDQKVVETVRHVGAEMIVYGGGGILRKRIIDSVGGWVINAHAGPLPEVRGMNAIEWATILGERQVVTVHLIDSGIDTGRLISETPISINAGDSIEGLRAKSVAVGVCAITDALKGISTPGDIATYDNPVVNIGLQCYQMSQALSELLATKLERA